MCVCEREKKVERSKCGGDDDDDAVVKMSPTMKEGKQSPRSFPSPRRIQAVFAFYYPLTRAFLYSPTGGKEHSRRENATLEKSDNPMRAASTDEFLKLKPTRFSLSPNKTLTTSSGASSVAAATMAAGAAMVLRRCVVKSARARQRASEGWEREARASFLFSIESEEVGKNDGLHSLSPSFPHKRKRETSMPPEDEFAALSRALATLRDRDSGAILTDEFLEVCRGVLPVIGEIFRVASISPLFFCCSRHSLSLSLARSSFFSALKTLLHLLNRRHHPGHFGAALAAIVRSDVGGNIERLERARRRGKEASGQTAGGAPSTSSPSSSSGAAASDPSFRLLFSIPLDEIERGADLGAKSDAKGLLWLKRANDFILLMLENLLKGTKEEGEGKKKNASSSSSSSSAPPPPPPLSVSAAARAAYNDTLRKFHGMLTAAAFSAALSVRERNKKRYIKKNLLLFFSPSSFSFFSLPCSRLSLLLLLLTPHQSGQLAPSRATFFSAVARSNGGRSSGESGGDGDDGGDGGDEARVLPSLSAFLEGFRPVLREVDEWLTAKGLNDPAKV